MKNYIPLMALAAVLTACGSMNFGSCNQPSCDGNREPLSMRSFGSERLNNAISIQYDADDYKGKCSCCVGMSADNQNAKKTAKRQAFSAPSVSDAAPAKAETKPKKSGWFF